MESRNLVQSTAERFRTLIETSALVELQGLIARAERTLRQWNPAPEELDDLVPRAVVLAAWELHPLAARLERQLAALEASDPNAKTFRDVWEILPHRLVEQNWNLVRKAAGRYHIPSQLENEAEFQELQSVGREALFYAAQKFFRKPRGNFSNFAWSILREKMREEQARRHPVPAKIRKKLAALATLREDARLSDKVLDKESIARSLDLPEQELRELLQIESVWGNGLEFETDVELEELEVADQRLDQLSMLLEIEDAQRLEQALAQMEGLEKTVIFKLYFEEKSLREVAEELQMSLPSFKKLHKRALTEMRLHLMSES